MFEKLKEIHKRILNRIIHKNKVFSLDTINYEKIVELMQEKGIYQEFENELNHFEEIDQLMQNDTYLHGINHVVRVLFNAYAIITLENGNEEDKKIVIEAVKLHDIGRTQDGEDTEHGNKSAIKARGILEDKGFSQEEIDEICFIIKEHSLPKQKNKEDIENLPEGLKEKYRYHLSLVKDADKLDRARIGDLDPKRLATDSAKRLVGVAEEVFRENRYYYKKKMQVYPVDEEEVKAIFAEVCKLDLEYKVTLETVRKNYSKLKGIQKQGKLELLKLKKDTIPLDDFIEIMDILTNEDMEYIYHRFGVGKRMIIQAIYDMGLNRYVALKAEGKLAQFMDVENYYNLIQEMTIQEKELMLRFRRIDYGNAVIKNFYLYWNAIRNYTPEQLDMLLLLNEDEFQYLNGRVSDKETGYKWLNRMLFIPDAYKMIAIKQMDPKQVLAIRQKWNIPLNVIATAMMELDLLQQQELEEADLEKIVCNYHKFHLNINQEKDGEQVKKMLLSLPQDLDCQYEPLIQECLAGRLKRFGLENFEQLENYGKICDEKIVQELQESNDVNALRERILTTKIKDLEGTQRDVYFYQKYDKQSARSNEVVNLFKRLLATQDNQELLDIYQRLNGIHPDFEWDGIFEQIREELAQISKQDVVLEMQKMQEKIKNAKTINKSGQPVMDITGTDFNLLISVIGAMGSPYLTSYYNNILHRLAKFKDRKILFPLFQKKADMQIKWGIRRLVNKRYKLDPLKNRQRCVSSIDQDFIGHIKSECYTNRKTQMEEKLILAYFPIDEKDISYMGNQDLMSIYDKERSDTTRKRVPHQDNVQAICNLKLQDLNATTIGDNNEVIVNSYPGAIVCFDHISNIARKTAQKLNLPILYMDTKKQFEIMKSKLEDYYAQMREQISQNTQMSAEMFDNAFHVFEQNHNVIHRAFQLANSFTFLDEAAYPKEQIIKVFNQMASLVEESLKRCNPEQRKAIQEIMQKEATPDNLRYGQYNQFISFKGLRDLVAIQKEEGRRACIKIP